MGGLIGHRGLLLAGSVAVSNGYTTLLNFDGADASTTMVDDTGNHTWTASGNAQLDTARTKWGAAALLLDGAGDYITAPSHADWTPGTSDDFGFACWVWQDSTGATSFRELFMANANGGLNILLIDGKLTTSRENIANILQCPSAIATDTWVHLEVNRASGSLRMYYDGVQQNSVANSTAFVQGAASIGAKTGGTSAFKGSIDSLVYKKGAAFHTGAGSFTPPSGPYTP